MVNRRFLGTAIAAAMILAACAEEEPDTSPDNGVVNESLEVVTETSELEVELEDELEDELEYEDELEDEYEDEELGGGQLEIGKATFYEGDCPFEIEIEIEVDCGTVEVPESREGLSDATIGLAVAILRTPSENPAPDPVVYLHGGPGGAALPGHASWLGSFAEWEFHAILSTRDMILVDQRGTGYSEPSLGCIDEEESDVCYGRLLDEGVTMAAYSTPENAADIAAIRIALGLEEWNIFGSSYGTRLGLVTLDNHPEGIRSLVLAGVYPPDKVPAYHDYMANSLRMIDALSAECRRQEACDTTYGDIEQLLVAALEETESGPSEYNAEGLFNAVFSAMYEMPTVSAVPKALWLAADGSIDEAMELLTAEDAGFQARGLGHWSIDLEDSTGKFNSVECREEQGFTDLEVLDGQAEEWREAGVNELLVSVLLSGAQATVESVCPIWDSGRAADEERLPTVSEVPTLVLSGEFDPITPPAWGDLAAASLSASTHVVVPSLSHSLVNRVQCIDDIVIEFLGDPTRQLSAECVAAMTVEPFLLP